MASTKEINFIIKAVKSGTGLEDIKKGLTDINKETQGTTTSTDSLVSSFKGLLPAMGLTAIIAGMKAMSDSARQYADDVDKIADITGVSAEQSSKWVIEAQHVGTEATTVGNAMAILSKNVIAGSDAFEKNGIQIKDNTGKMLPLENILAQVRNREKELGEGAKTTAMEMNLFGKSGKELHDFLSADNEEMKAVTDSAEELGLILNKTQKDDMEQMNRKMNDFKMVSQSLGMELNKTFIPALIFLETVILKVAKAFNMAFGGQAEKDINKANETINAGMVSTATNMLKLIDLMHKKKGGDEATYQAQRNAQLDIIKKYSDVAVAHESGEKIITASEKSQQAKRAQELEKHNDKVKAMEQKLNDETLKLNKDDFTSRKKLIDEHLKEYKKMGVDKNTLDKWYKGQLDKLQEEQTKNLIDELKLQTTGNKTELLLRLTEQQAKLTEGTMAYQLMGEEIKKVNTEINNDHKKIITDIVSRHTVDLLEGVRKGNLDISGVMQSLVDDVVMKWEQMIADMVANWVASQLVGGLNVNVNASGGGGGGGGGLGGAIGGAGKGASVGGAVAGPVGAVVGGVIGAIGGFFGFEKGGIVTSPVNALIGEGGKKEAVIPLESKSGIETLRKAIGGEKSGKGDTYNISISVGAFMGTETQAYEFAKLIKFYIDKINRREMTV